MMADGKVRVQYKRSADVMVLAGFFYDFAEKLAEKGKYHNAVLNDQVVQCHVCYEAQLNESVC
eukprot:m.185121 g.185121  ORF g.185121 m.185121 type:complete len:63 (+) comp39334_c0_seq67:2029-2217(+)